jgi:hypothetical protein
VLGGSGGGPHDGTARDGELDRERADAARAAVHEQRLAGAEPGDADQVGPDRAGDLGEARGLDQRYPVRHGKDLAGRYRDLLGVAAAGQQRAHLVAGVESLDPGASFGDAAGALQARMLGRAGRWRVEPAALEQVGTVDRGGDHVDQDLTGPGSRIGHLGPGQNLGTARLTNCCREHGRWPPRTARTAA